MSASGVIGLFQLLPTTYNGKETRMDAPKAEDRRPAQFLLSRERQMNEAIRDALENQLRAHIICLDSQKDGTFTPIISIDGHSFKCLVYYNGSGAVAFEMYERLSLDEQALLEFRGKIKRADMTLKPKPGEERSMRFCMTKRPEHLAVIGVVPFKMEDGREKIAEALRAKLSFIITMVSMLYFGMFDGPEGNGITKPTLTPAA